MENFVCANCKIYAQHLVFDINNLSNTIYKESVILINDNHLYYNNRSILPKYTSDLFGLIERNLKNNFQIDWRLFSCSNCKSNSLKINDEFIYPKNIIFDQPNQDLDLEISNIYKEAALIFNESPRGAAALLRLALQMLLKQIGEKGANINDDINNLASSGKLDNKLFQSLEVLRVVGNQAVHPGTIDFSDGKDIASKLFELINFIATELITKPKELNSFYEKTVPESKRKPFPEN